MAAFGPNEWLVDELYEQYKNDKNSVDKVWWSLFEDYQPSVGNQPAGDSGANGSGANGSPAQAAPKAAPPASAPAPAPRAEAPAAAETPKDAPKPREPEAPKATPAVNQDEVKPLRGASARTVINMEASLSVPTATSVRAVPAKLLIDNRVVINNHLQRSR